MTETVMEMKYVGLVSDADRNLTETLFVDLNYLKPTKLGAYFLE